MWRHKEQTTNLRQSVDPPPAFLWFPTACCMHLPTPVDMTFSTSDWRLLALADTGAYDTNRNERNLKQWSYSTQKHKSLLYSSVVWLFSFYSVPLSRSSDFSSSVRSASTGPVPPSTWSLVAHRSASKCSSSLRTAKNDDVQFGFALYIKRIILF